MNEIALENACLAIVDCVNRTAPEDAGGDYFIVGTPAMRGNTINFDEARRVNLETFATWNRRLMPEDGDLLIAREAPVGPVVRIPSGGRVGAGQRTTLLRPDTATVLSRFLYYYLIWPKTQERFLMRAHGSTVPHVRVADVRSFTLQDLPPISVQRAIAEVLGALDDKIAANLLLERTADDLIAAYAERAGLAVMENVSFLAAVDVTFGAAFKGTLFAPPGEGRPLIRIRDLKTHAPQTWTTEERRDETVIAPGDVVVGMDADFEPACWLGEPALLNQRVMRVSCDAWGSALTRYLVTPPLRQIQSSKTGTTVAHLNKSDLATLELPKLPQENVAAVRGIVDSLLLRRVASAKERSRLGSLRDVLLPELMSGRLRVKDAEKTVEGVV